MHISLERGFQFLRTEFKPNQQVCSSQSIGFSVAKTVRPGLLLKYTTNAFIICKYMLRKTAIIFRADPFTF
jgi:hypothetical protein